MRVLDRSESGYVLDLLSFLSGFNCHQGKQDNHTPTRLPSMDPFVEFRGMDKLETLFNAALGQQHESEVLEKPRRKHMKKSQVCEALCSL